MTQKFRRVPLLATAILVVLAALVLAACGGSSDSSTSGGSTSAGESTSGESTSGSEGGSELASLEKIVDKYSKPPAGIGPTEPIGKPIPEGKNIDYIQCSAESCIIVGAALKEAAEVLGWNLKIVNYEPTPQSIQAAFDAAVRDSPDAVLQLGISASEIAPELRQLHEKEIPVYAATTAEEQSENPGPEELDLSLIDPKTNSESTRILAAKTIVDAGGEGEIGTILLTGYSAIKPYYEAYVEEIETKCPDCTVKELELSPEELGKDAPQKVANFLRANPDIGYLFYSLDDIGGGVAQALAAAGVEEPKTYGHSPSSIGLEALATGERTAATPGPTPEVGWQMMDALARYFTGQSIADDYQWQGTILWSKAYNNLPENPEKPVYVENYQKEFEELWGK